MDYTDSNWLKLKVTELDHTKEMVTDSRLEAAAILTIKNVPEVHKPKSYVIDKANQNVVISKTNKYLALSGNVTINLFQIIDVETNVDSIKSLSNEDKELYAFAVIKLLYNTLLAKQIEPVVDLAVEIEFVGMHSIRTSTFNLRNGKVKDESTTIEKVPNLEPAPSEPPINKPSYNDGNATPEYVVDAREQVSNRPASRSNRQNRQVRTNAQRQAPSFSQMLKAMKDEIFRIFKFK